MGTTWIDRGRRARGVLASAENGLLATLLIALTVIACTQVVRRNLFHDAWIHADTFGRALVLWIAMLGAWSAVRTGQHVAIDFLGRLLGDGWRRAMRATTDIFAAVFCGGMAWLAFELMRLDVDVGMEWIPGVSVIWPFGIVPLGFALMALRFMVSVVLPPPDPVSASDADVASER